ncbi:C6 zinc finger domain protein [Aspergillus keveii]|uniref:C6 zinc finger domain protein n=1 Tax=Aspergillus keveii TaxID=714993 RepID=A0ABR4GAW3_9EURO
MSGSSSPRRVKRAHTKSRQGCFSCKSRRIKCQETKPACKNCVRKGLDCVYPSKGDRKWRLVAADQRQFQRHSQTLSSSMSPHVSTTPFTGDDLRFWHHFLVNAQPGLPIGDEGTWSSEIPALAHECPHLLHALLSLGASYCSLTQGRQYIPLAIAHRGKALRSLGTIIAKGDKCTTIEMDSALAASLALTFQARYMSDGVIDFAVMVRGSSIIVNRYSQNGRKSAVFHQVKSQDGIMQTTALPWEPKCLVDPSAVAACIAALDRLQPLLRRASHFEFYNVLRSSYLSLLGSYRQAFIQLTIIYVLWAHMENSEFSGFVSPDDHISRALFMHYITIDSFMRPVYAKLSTAQALKSRAGDFIIYRWAEAIYNDLPISLQMLVYHQFQHLAVDLLPSLASHKTLFPEWKHELSEFVALVRKRVPSHILEVYDIE